MLSALIIAVVTYFDGGVLSPAKKDTIKMLAPFLSYVITLFAIWLFVKNGFDTIEGMKEANLRNKFRKELQDDIHILTQAIQSNLLTEQDRVEKQKELAEKISELTNTKPKARSTRN